MVQGEYPKSLKKVLINTIIKPGKNPTDTKSHRFISRISCIGKIYENIITKRLTWFLEHHNKPDKDLNGFRPSRSTTEALQILDNHINKAFVDEQYTLIACIDLEKAFDTIMKH